MNITGIILKANMVIPGYPLKLHVGVSIPVTDRNKNNGMPEKYFVSRITFHPEDSDFVGKHRLSSGCYVISMAGNSENYCVELNANIEEKYIIMEDVVAMVLSK